jgi:hypothetical protein
MIQLKASREAAEISGAFIDDPKRLTKSLRSGAALEPSDWGTSYPEPIAEFAERPLAKNVQKDPGTLRAGFTETALWSARRRVPRISSHVLTLAAR